MVSGYNWGIFWCGFDVHCNTMVDMNMNWNILLSLVVGLVALILAAVTDSIANPTLLMLTAIWIAVLNPVQRWWE